MTEQTNAFIERYLRPASDEHYATLMSPAATRGATAAAFAFYQQMRGLLAIQPDVAPTKISWWHDALSQLREARAAHPVLQPLLAHATDECVDDLNALLHGAVMDFNRVDVDADNLDDYLRLRAGALHCLLARIEGRTISAAGQLAIGRLYGLSEVLREAREPGYANQPTAPIALDQAQDNDAMTAALRSRVESARAAASGAGGGVASHVAIALRLAHWPKIVSSEFGATIPPLPVWRKLLLAWRAARRA